MQVYLYSDSSAKFLTSVWGTDVDATVISIFVLYSRSYSKTCFKKFRYEKKSCNSKESGTNCWCSIMVFQGIVSLTEAATLQR